MGSLDMRLRELIADAVRRLDRPDLFRAPLVAVSAADDPRYAQLKTIIGPWHLEPRELLPDAERVISYFVPFTRNVVQDPRRSSGAPAVWGESYIVLNDYFDQIGRAGSALLEGEGYSCCPIAGTHTYDPKDLKSMWSHRSAAAIAGLGAFGANRMLITEKGSGGRFCTILTSAPLEVNSAPAVDRCLYHRSGSCGLCFRSCPAGALKPDSFDRFRCHDTVLLPNAEELKDIGFCDVCGKCISVCPMAYLE